VPIIPSYLLLLDVENDALSANDALPDHTRSEGDITAFLLNITHSLHDNSSYPITHFAKESYMKENSKVGWLLSSKAITQLLANPFIGPLTNRLEKIVYVFLTFLSRT
jgi:hypothetical protein